VAALLLTLGLLIVGASIAALLARALKQPLLLGYVAAGAILGPAMTGIITDSEPVELLSELGIIFLMFIIGLELDLSKVKDVGKISVLIGTLQVAATTLIELLFQYQVFPALGVEERATLRTDLLLIIPARVLEACLFVCLYVWAKETLPGATLRKKGLVLAFALIGGVALVRAFVALGDFHVAWPVILAGFLAGSIALIFLAIPDPGQFLYDVIFKSRIVFNNFLLLPVYW